MTIWKPKWHERNIERLLQLAPHTRAAALKWYQFCLMEKIDVYITETIRTKERQRELMAAGASQTMTSYHIVGQAFDFVPMINGQPDYTAYKKHPFSAAVAYAKALGFEWGGDWRKFVDSPHMQFNHKGYGTDKGDVPYIMPTLEGPPYKVIIPNTAFWQARNLVREFEGRGVKCYGQTVKKYAPGEEPQDTDPFLFVIETNLENAKLFVIELQTRGYHLAYGEAITD
jgi:hypothetical protein